MALFKKNRLPDGEKRVLTAEGWLRRVRFTITAALPQTQEKKTKAIKTGRPRGRPKKK